MNEGLWMGWSVRFSTGHVLRQYEPVEIYNSRLCRGRFEDAAIEAAFASLRLMQAQAGDDKGRKPVIVIHCGRLHVVEARCLTTDPPPAPPEVAAPAKPAKQMALF